MVNVKEIGAETLKPLVELNVENRSMDQFEIPRQNADYVIEHSVGFNDKPEIAVKAQQLQGKCYSEYGYVDRTALLDDGRLVPELDSSRDNESGEITVNYLLARRNDKAINEAGATLRLIDVGENSSFENLPTYKYFKGDFSDLAKVKLNNLVDLYGAKAIREIAALGSERHDIKGSYELMRAVMQNSLIKAERDSCREVYLASLTKVSLGPIRKFAGPSAIEVLREPILVHAGDFRQNEVFVTPVLIDPNKALDGFLDEIESAERNTDIVRLVQKINFLIDGLSREQISKRVVRFLDRIN